MKNYVIFNVSEINKVDFSKVFETNQNTIRKSVDGLKSFVKWSGDPPSFINDLTTKEGIYTEKQINKILEKDEWNKFGASSVKKKIKKYLDL